MTSSCSSKSVICFTTPKQFPITRLSPNKCSSLTEVVRPRRNCVVEVEGHKHKPKSKLGNHRTQTHKEDPKEVCCALSSGLRHSRRHQSTSLNLILTCLRLASLTTPVQKVGRVVIWGDKEGSKWLFKNSSWMKL